MACRVIEHEIPAYLACRLASSASLGEIPESTRLENGFIAVFSPDMICSFERPFPRHLGLVTSWMCVPNLLARPFTL